MDVVGAALFGVHVDSKGDVDNEFARRASAIFNGLQSWKMGLMMLFPTASNLLKRLGVDLSVFGSKEDVDFFVRHLERLIQQRSDNVWKSVHHLIKIM